MTRSNSVASSVSCFLVMTTLLAVGMGFVAPAVAAPSPASCDIAAYNHAEELQNLLSRRAVEVVEHAARADWKTDVRLAQEVTADAPTDLGAGDVEGRLGVGAAGFRALVKEMHADTYRYLGYDYIDMTVTPCGRQKVTVEFSDTGARFKSDVEFTFIAGRVAAAKGWTRTFQTGPVSPVSEGH